MSHVVPSVPFPHYSLRFPLAEAFPELKAMEGWGQDATASSVEPSGITSVPHGQGCVCVSESVPGTAFVRPGAGRAARTFCLGLALPVWGLPQCLGVCPGPELALLASVSWFLEEDGGDLGTGTQSGRLDPLPPRTLAPHVVLSPSPLRS